MYKYKNVEIELICGDITKQTTDAIVNAANNTLLGGGGVDGAIHKAGGKEILDQCKKIGGCPTGEAKITVAGNLKSKYVIHTVGPIYKDGRQGEDKLLYNAYYNSLSLGYEYGLKTISFPSISTGAYNYPIKTAAVLALEGVIDFLDENEDSYDKVTFVLFSEEDYMVYKEICDKKLS